jgi:hypothetical protein
MLDERDRRLNIKEAALGVVGDEGPLAATIYPFMLPWPSPLPSTIGRFPPFHHLCPPFYVRP